MELTTRRTRRRRRRRAKSDRRGSSPIDTRGRPRRRNDEWGEFAPTGPTTDESGRAARVVGPMVEAVIRQRAPTIVLEVEISLLASAGTRHLPITVSGPGHRPRCDGPFECLERRSGRQPTKDISQGRSVLTDRQPSGRRPGRDGGHGSKRVLLPGSLLCPVERHGSMAPVHHSRTGRWIDTLRIERRVWGSRPRPKIRSPPHPPRGFSPEPYAVISRRTGSEVVPAE